MNRPLVERGGEREKPRLPFLRYFSPNREPVHRLASPQQSLHNYANFGGVGVGERSVLWQCFVFSNIIEVRSSRERIVSNIFLLFSIRSYTKENFP